MMNHNSSFDERFNAELNKRLGIQSNVSAGGLAPDELASAESLLNLAENLHQAPAPTLSAASKARIEAALHAQVLAHPPQSVRVRRFARWQFFAATLVLLLGIGSAFALWDSIREDEVAQVTTIQEGTPAEKESPLPTESISSTPGDGDEFTASTPNPADNSDVTPNIVVVCENDLSYWQNNLENWDIDSLTIGNREYVQADLVTILATPAESDASLALAKAIIVAYLNDRSEQALAEANVLLEGYSGKLPFEIDATTTIGRAMLETASNLDAITTNCQTPTPTTDSDNSTGPDNQNDASPDTCKNPPPDHANAQGWRDRCENGTKSNNGNGNKK